MTDYLTSFLSLFFSTENQFITMFISSLISASILPGNSEIIFTTIASQTILLERTFYSSSLAWLILVATIGNTLGSLITFGMGKLVEKPKALTNKYAEWILNKLNRYGALMLLLSWLPIVGDLICGIAGWLRFPFIKSLIYIFIGKFVRYLLLLGTIYPLVKYIL
nr:VTT domain-containing protein [uncultured Haemophilus sp.]